MNTCGQCDHYVHLGEGKNGKGEATEVGNCFRYPPTPTEKGSVYPIVGKTERQCGEFKRKAGRK
jgi:hypothetical protein